MSDPLGRLLAGLPPATLEPGRAERIRRSCHARLARHAARRSGSTIAFTPMWRVFVAALGAAYLIGAIVQAIRVLE